MYSMQIRPQFVKLNSPVSNRPINSFRDFHSFHKLKKLAQSPLFHLNVQRNAASSNLGKCQHPQSIHFLRNSFRILSRFDVFSRLGILRCPDNKPNMKVLPTKKASTYVISFFKFKKHPRKVRSWSERKMLVLINMVCTASSQAWLCSRNQKPLRKHTFTFPKDHP